MAEWHKTGCVLCNQNCGLEVLIEDNRLLKSRPDRDNPRSQGYACRKGLNVAFHQHHADRLERPLKRVGGELRPVSWDQALDEIAARLKEIVGTHGPRSLAYMGGGGQGCHLEAAFGVRLLRGLGSHYHYSPLGQELTGAFWAWGRALGRQYLHPICDLEGTEMLMAWGWNGWMSHQVPQARRVLQRISKDPERILVVVDPRRSETAQRADLHLALRPGTDALLAKAMIALILEEGLHDPDYIAAHVDGFQEIEPWFRGFDTKAAIKVCGLDYGQVRELCRFMGRKAWSLRPDLGVLMGRHSTLTSYLHVLLLALCGRIGVPGGDVIPGHLMPIGAHSDERREQTWRTVATDYPAILGVFPPNVVPEEILSGHPKRLRALIVSQCNPLRSYADTAAYQEAFGKLDLLVCVEMALTETATRADYVLPSRSGYEAYDATFFAHNWPEIYFQLRRPLIKPEGETMEPGGIMVELADRLGLIPEIPEALRQAARGGDMGAFGREFAKAAAENKALRAMAPFVLARTLGVEMGSVHKAALWGILNSSTKEFYESAARAGFAPGPGMGQEIFRALEENPQGLWIGKLDPRKNLDQVKTGSGRIEIHAPEMAEWTAEITPEAEEAALEKETAGFPLVLCAGRRLDLNANTQMRDPAWNKGRRDCTLALNPADAEELGIKDGELARVSTPAGAVEIEVEITREARAGQPMIPHGFGLVHEGKVHGVNVNLLTRSAHRDRLAGTPLHRFVPCRVEKS